MDTTPAPENPAPNFSVAIRMADEGIPVLAIARATAIPSGDIYVALRNAIQEGHIVEMPNDDWPPGSRRIDRCISKGTPLEKEEELKTALTRFFRTSPLEAAMFTLLLRRDEVTKVQLHSVIEACRDPQKETTEIKMVDVMICKLRKKLIAHNVKIETMWGTGYYISKEHRREIYQLLLGMKASA